MNFFRVYCLLLMPALMVSCTSITPSPAGTSGIVVGPNESRACGQGMVLFPAGLYQPQVVSAKGTYYLAPDRIRTAGVLLSRSERGGIYVSTAAGNPQAAWFGDVQDIVESKPTTLLGAIGVSAPKLWPYTPRIPFQVEKTKK